MRPVASPADTRGDRNFLVSADHLTITGSAIGAIVTVVIAATPGLTFGFRSPSGHLVLDSIDGCVAALLAYLVYGRFLRYRRLQDLLLAQGLALLAVAGLLVSYVSEWLTGSADATLDVWLPLAVRVMGALIFAAAAFAGDARSPSTARRRCGGLAPTAVALVTCVVLWSVRGALPTAVDKHIPPPQHPYLSGHTALWVLQGVGAIGFFAASLLFTRQARKSHDPLLRWLGPACALAAFARVNYVLYPSLYTDWLYAGDFLRTASYLVLVVAALREIRHYWDAHARALLADERRRLAGELHDGLIQELGYIRGEILDLPDVIERRKLITHACDRAIDEARAAVYTLAHHGDDPIDIALSRTAAEAGERHGVRVDVISDGSVIAAPEQQHSLLRIMSEAVANAAEHGRAEHIEVVLDHSAGRFHLSIRDDGHGFEVPAEDVVGPGYGLTSMRERARSLPGSLDITSVPGTGSVVTVTW
jgi:signal transduction histidine kinase